MVLNNKTLNATLIGIALMLALADALSAAPQYLRLPVSEYRDKMMGGWIGQIAGVSQGAPTEFKYADRIMPEAEMPKWSPKMINDAFGQDDLYVEMTFLRTLEQHGLNVSMRQAGIDFANSQYGLWCANNAGRTNLRSGIAPPDSGHPKFNKCPNDIDYQIEADYSGLIGPGMPNVPIQLGEKFGHLMNYGDGVYAGQFMGGMYSAAFFETDIRKIVEAGLQCIPAESQYAQMARDMLLWSKQNADWQVTWQQCQQKYRQDPEFQKSSNGGIDCKINGAYVLMGLLYGQGDIAKTIEISCRCGLDSDCNPSSAAGVLCASIGFSKLPDEYKRELDNKTNFSYTSYNVPGLVKVCDSLARKWLRKQGGRITTDQNGEEIMLIPIKAAKPSALELSWAPGAIANSRFGDAEMAKITVLGAPEAAKKGMAVFAPGWKISQCGPDMNPGLRAQERGQTNVMVTHPMDRAVPCILSKSVKIPAGKTTTLKLLVANHPGGDWELIVKAGEQELLKKAVSKETTNDGWMEVAVDLTPFAGKTIKLSLLNQPTEWFCEAGYWARIAIESR